MLETATKAARAAGELLMGVYGSPPRVDRAERNDIKLEADRHCEALIVQILRERFPDHAVLGEEGGFDAGGAEYLWIVDPLDGTVNYYYGLPHFCVSIACYRAPGPGDPRELGDLGTPVVAVVYAPVTDELFAAAPGMGTTRNGAPVRASSVERLEEALVATGFGKLAENIDYMTAGQTALVGRVRKLRCFGAAALDLAYVACGRLSGFCERGLRSWDIAAGRLLVEEAGGRFVATPYAPHAWNVVAAAEGIFEELAEHLPPDPAVRSAR